MALWSARWRHQKGKYPRTHTTIITDPRMTLLVFHELQYPTAFWNTVSPSGGPVGLRRVQQG